MGRKPRFRLTIGRMMFAVLIAAVALWPISRPYPTECLSLGSHHYLFWSDGAVTGPEGPNALTLREKSWFLAVDFPDGSTHYYLTVR